MAHLPIEDPSGVTFPPDHHLFRDLALSTMLVDVRRTAAVAPINDGLRDGSGNVDIGYLATILDMVSAPLVLASASPDWTVTSDLSVSLSATPPAGPLFVEANLLRGGSRVIVVGAVVRDGVGASVDELFDQTSVQDEDRGLVAIGDLSFVRVPASGSAVSRADLPKAGEKRKLGEQLPGRPLRERIHVVDAGGGAVTIEADPYVQNSRSAIAGGVHAIAMQRAAESLMPGFNVVDLTVRYLAQARKGGIHVRAQPVRVSSDCAACRLEAFDEHGGSLVSVGHAVMKH